MPVVLADTLYMKRNGKPNLPRVPVIKYAKAGAHKVATKVIFRHAKHKGNRFDTEN